MFIFWLEILSLILFCLLVDEFIYILFKRLLNFDFLIVILCLVFDIVLLNSCLIL